MTVAIDFSKYHRYDELVGDLQRLAEAYPDLTRLYSIGKSFEGRDLWCLEITTHATGDHGDKPGYYIDANLHAGEVTGTACALYTAWYLLTNYGSSDEVTRLVDTITFYILPRVSPDGAEKYLTTPYFLRSSVRPYPFEEEQDGLYQADIDGNGLILQMRIPDPDGEWKVSAKDARLMIPRLPHEVGGQYYRLYLEGLVRSFDGVEIKAAPMKWGLDMNRQFPVGWEPEAKQAGAGPYPMSEPETRAIGEFLLERRNIVGGQSFHTTTGIILRPSAFRTDDKMPAKDRLAWNAIGQVGERLTGYPCVSVFDGFAYDKEKPIKGSFLDWCYENLGLMVYSTELWDLRVRAGLDRVPFLTPHMQRDVEAEGLAMLAWIDRELAGEGFVDWYDFDHPQFGKVQLGGWRMKDLLQNAPQRFLEAEAHKNALFCLRHAAAAPRLELTRAAAAHLGDGVYRVEVVVKNRGYLPTNVTEQAKTVKAVKPILAEVALPPGAELVLGKPREELEHLDGRIVPNACFYPSSVVAQRERRVEWIVKAPSGGPLTVRVLSERAGKVAAVLSLGAEV
ncbi:MAG TPA: M14 family metallopeptidase [Symbiobacteriaceae bacterium]|nr:M14 family metallopeptidase [Symbiobacteriaceae bacterium]